MTNRSDRLMAAGVVRNGGAGRAAWTALRQRGRSSVVRREREHVGPGDASGRAEVSLGEGSAQQVRAAYLGYVAYFGTYEVAADGKSVVHHVDAALNPAWVGGDQVRAMRFEGERLVLSAGVTKNRVIVTHVLTWERC